MVAYIVGGVSDGRETCAVRVTCVRQKLLRLLHVRLMVCRVDIRLAAVCVVNELTAVRINPAGTHKVACRRIGALHQRICHILTVDGKAQRLTHLGIVEGLSLRI